MTKLLTDSRANEGGEAELITVNAEWCKGCGICAALCPREALTMRAGLPVLSDPARCTLCALCEQRCPDFAILCADKSVLRNR